MSSFFVIDILFMLEYENRGDHFHLPKNSLWSRTKVIEKGLQFNFFLQRE